MVRPNGLIPLVHNSDRAQLGDNQVTLEADGVQRHLEVGIVLDEGPLRRVPDLHSVGDPRRQHQPVLAVEHDLVRTVDRRTTFDHPRRRDLGNRDRLEE